MESRNNRTQKIQVSKAVIEEESILAFLNVQRKEKNCLCYKDVKRLLQELNFTVRRTASIAVEQSRKLFFFKPIEAPKSIEPRKILIPANPSKTPTKPRVLSQNNVSPREIKKGQMHSCQISSERESDQPEPGGSGIKAKRRRIIAYDSDTESDNAEETQVRSATRGNNREGSTRAGHKYFEDYSFKEDAFSTTAEFGSEMCYEPDADDFSELMDPPSYCEHEAINIGETLQCSGKENSFSDRLPFSIDFKQYLINKRNASKAAQSIQHLSELFKFLHGDSESAIDVKILLNENEIDKFIEIRKRTMPEESFKNMLISWNDYVIFLLFKKNFDETDPSFHVYLEHLLSSIGLWQCENSNKIVREKTAKGLKNRTLEMSKPEIEDVAKLCLTYHNCVHKKSYWKHAVAPFERGVVTKAVKKAFENFAKNLNSSMNYYLIKGYLMSYICLHEGQPARVAVNLKLHEYAAIVQSQTYPSLWVLYVQVPTARECAKFCLDNSTKELFDRYLKEVRIWGTQSKSSDYFFIPLAGGYKENNTGRERVLFQSKFKLRKISTQQARKCIQTEAFNLISPLRYRVLKYLGFCDRTAKRYSC